MSRVSLEAVWDDVHRHLGWPTPPLDRTLPVHDAPWRAGIVEIRLHGDRRADLMGAIERAPPPDSTLARAVPPALDAWGTVDDRHGVPLQWFEWDDPRRTRAPVWSVATSRHLRADDGARRPPQRQHHDWCDALAATVSSGRVTTLAPLRDALGDDGELLHLASLAARGHDALRTTWHVRAEAIPRWLDAVDWPGDTGAVARALTALVPPQIPVAVQLEIDPTPRPRLDIEVPEARGPRARTLLRRRLAAVAHLAVVDADLADRVAAWPSDDDAVRHAYAKLVRTEDAWTAKAYLGTSPHAVDQALRAAWAAGVSTSTSVPYGSE